MTATATEAPPFTRLDVCARRFAIAWRAVIGAASTDDQRGPIYRSVLIEQHDDGLLLVATNSYLMLYTWVGRDDANHLAGPPPIEDAPRAEIIVRDVSGLPAALFAHVAKNTKNAGVADRTTALELAVGRIEPHPDRPTLGAEVDQPALIARCWNEAVAIPIVEGNYPAWRSALSPGAARGSKRVRLDPDQLRIVANVRTDDLDAVSMTFLGADRGVDLCMPGDPTIYGRLMPMEAAE